MTQDKLFSDEEVIEKNWNLKYPCPRCEVGKLRFTTTDEYSYLSCFNCHWTWRREADYKETRELTGRYGGGKADS